VYCEPKSRMRTSSCCIH